MSSYWHLAGRTSLTCLLEQGRRRQLGSRREAFCKVHEWPVQATKVSENATPAADSENQVPSKARLVPALLVSPLHCCRKWTPPIPLPTATLWTSLLSATPPFQISLSPVCYPSHAVLVLFFSVCLCNPNFLPLASFHFPLGEDVPNCRQCVVNRNDHRST